MNTPKFALAGAIGLGLAVATTDLGAQTSTLEILGKIDTADTNNPFDIMSGDDVVVTTTWTTALGVGNAVLTPGVDVDLAFLLDIFDPTTGTSRLGMPIDEEDDFGFPTGDGPTYSFTGGTLNFITFTSASLDPSFEFFAQAPFDGEMSGVPNSLLDINGLAGPDDPFAITGLTQARVSGP